MSRWPALDAQLAAQVANATARALDEVNGVRGDIGLPPIAELIPAPLDEAADDPLPLDRCPITLSVIAGAPDGWACRWEGWDKIEITRPGHDPILMVVPACVDLHILWGRRDVPALALDPPAPVPYTATPRFGEQLSLLAAAA